MYIPYMLKKMQIKWRRDGTRATFIALASLPFTLKGRLEYHRMLRKSTIKDKFSEVYDKAFWGGGESSSGGGSSLKYTAPLRAWLVDLIQEYGVQTVVDAPCGDFNWMKEVTREVSLSYKGFDIVDSVIERNRALYEDEQRVFAVGDICVDPLPPCDILMVRDCLFHFSFEAISRFLQNIESVNFRFLLTTTHVVPKNFRNSDIMTGDFRLISLFAPPFSFDPNSVIARVNDYPEGDGFPREMVLIAKKDVPITLKS